MYVFISKGEHQGDERKIHEQARLVLTFITGVQQMDPAALNRVYTTKTAILQTIEGGIQESHDSCL